MRLEDETLLSAYLDDELGPQDRLRVESALRSNPELAWRFRQLAEVREILQSLSRIRPGLDSASAPDVTEAVLQKLARRREARRSARVLALRSVLVAAAAVLVALTLAPWSPWARQDPRQPRIADQQAIPDPNLALVGSDQALKIAPPTPDEVDPLLLENRSNKSELVDHAPTWADRLPIDLELLDRERLEFEQRDFLRELLERPEVSRLVLKIPDDQDPEPILEVLDDLVDKIVRKQPRYGRIQLNDGLIVDSFRPGEAIVYTLWADLLERKAILDEFANRVEGDLTLKEEPIDPEVTTMLAETGVLSVHPGSLGEIYQNPDTEAMQAIRNPVEGISVPSPPGTRNFPKAGNVLEKTFDSQEMVEPRTVLIWVEMPMSDPGE